MSSFTSAEILFALQRHPLFSSFDASFLESLSRSDIAELAPGDRFSPQKGAKDEDYYVLLDGKIDVFATVHGDSYLLDHLIKGAVFGNRYMGGAFIEIKERAFLLIISKRKIYEMAVFNPVPIAKLLEKLHAKTLLYLEKINEATVALIRQKKNMGLFIINLTIFLSLFSIIVPYLAGLIKEVTPALITTPLVLAGGLFLIIRLTLAHVPLSSIRIHTRNLRRTLFESVSISIILIALIILCKFLIINLIQNFHDRQLFNLYTLRMQERYGITLTTSDMFIFAAVYALHAFFQEVLVRGGLQGMFSHFFSHRYQKILAIVLASLVFACAHAYFGTFAVLAVFVPGLFWGWLYARQNNIFGVALSHMLVGTTILTFVGPF